MSRIQAKHSFPTRLFHWLNVPILAGMIYSGLLIYWANDIYKIRIGSWITIPFFPAWFNSALSLPQRLAEGMAWHFAFMWFFAINGLVYVTYTLCSGEWRYLLPNSKSPSEAFQVVLHDLGVREEPLPHRKFNGAQRIAYTGVVLMGLGSLVTGLAIFRTVQVAWLTNLLGGYEWARFEHFALTLGYVGFFIIHVTQVIRAGWNNFRAMVTGVEIARDEEPSYESA